jgi:hypothetical protein
LLTAASESTSIDVRYFRQQINLVAGAMPLAFSHSPDCPDPDPRIGVPLASPFDPGTWDDGGDDDPVAALMRR